MTHQSREEEIRVEKSRVEKKKKGRFAPPSLQEVTAYCQERQNNVNPQDFIDHYEANGWMRGKTKIKCWRACVRTWEKRRESKQEKKSNVTRFKEALINA